MKKQRIKTTEPVTTNIFNSQNKEIVYGEVSIVKLDGKYEIEILNYTEDSNGIVKVLRSKSTKVPFYAKPKQISYNDFDALVTQFEQLLPSLPTFDTSAERLDYLALQAMLLINNGVVPDIGETETSVTCGVQWEIDTIQDPEPETLEE